MDRKLLDSTTVVVYISIFTHPIYSITVLSGSTIVDDFNGVHVYYNTKNKVEYVEIFNGTVTYNGVTIFPGKENNLIKTLGCSFTNNINKTYNIGYEADNGELKSIGFGGPGYYK